MIRISVAAIISVAVNGRRGVFSIIVQHMLVVPLATPDPSRLFESGHTLMLQLVQNSPKLGARIVAYKWKDHTGRTKTF